MKQGTAPVSRSLGKPIFVGCLAIFALVLVCAGIAAFQLRGQTLTPVANPYTAQRYCEDAIRVHLKSPATAQFANEQRLAVEGERFAITGTVDAENAFGALLRQRFECTVAYTGNGQYQVEAAQLTGP